MDNRIIALMAQGYTKEQAQEGRYHQNNNLFFMSNAGQPIPTAQTQEQYNVAQGYDPKMGYTGYEQGDEFAVDQTESDPRQKAYKDYLRLKIANPYWGQDPMTKIYGSGLAFGAGKTAQGVLGASAGVLGIARNFFSGLGAGKENARQENDMMKMLYGQNPNYQYGQTGSNATYAFQEGGKITNADMMTNSYITDMPTQNLEIERGEYVKNGQSGVIQEAKGKTHKQGGIGVNLPDESKILSDFTKIGTENAKKFKEQFDIAFKASHTFADVMDKVNSKIGLTKLIEQEKEYTAKIEKQLKSSVDETTKKVNLNFLAKEVEKLEKQKQMLTTIQDKIFEDVFRAQEAIPKRGNGIDLVKQEGGQTQQEQPTAEEIVQIFAEMSGQNPEEIIAQLQQMPPEEQMQAIQQMAEQVQGGQQQEAPMEQPMQQEEQMMLEGGLYKAEEGLKKISKSELEKYKKLGYTQDPKNPNRYILKGSSKESVTVIPGSEAVIKKGTVGEKRKPIVTQAWLDASSEERKAMSAKQDAAWAKNPKSKTTPDEIIKPAVAPTEKKEVVVVPDEEIYLEEQKTYPTAKKEEGVNPRILNRTVMPQLPQNYILPPDSLRGVYKPGIDLSRLAPIKISPESNLAAIEQQRQATADSLSFLPENQRASLLANMLGTTQASANQAIGQTTQANAASQYQADVYNASQADKEQLTNINLAKDYEAKMYGAIRNTDIDLRSYYDQLNRQNRQNFLGVANLNMVNQLTPNYQSTGADSYFNSNSPNISNTQANPYLQQMFDATENDPKARMAFMKSLYQAQQA